MEYLVVKSEDWKYYKQSGLLISSILTSVLNQLEKSIGQEQQEAKEEQKPTISDSVIVCILYDTKSK